MGESTQGARPFQDSAATLALPHQCPVQLHQQALVQVPGAAVHHFAQRDLNVVLILRSRRMQVHRVVVVQMHIQPCDTEQSLETSKLLPRSDAKHLPNTLVALICPQPCQAQLCLYADKV